MDDARAPSDSIAAVLNVRGVTHAGHLSVGRGWLEFRAAAGSSLRPLRLLLPSVSRVQVDGERLFCMTAASKFFCFTFQSAAQSRRIEDALARELVSPVGPPALANRAGWDVYDHAAEHKRAFGELLGTRKSPYRFCTLNAQYELCPTYPYLLVVPAALNDNVLRGSAAFRSKGRLPALTWRHPVTGATLSRCAQPLVGFFGGAAARSESDEMVLEQIRKACGAPMLHIVDCRPLLNAHANKMTGGGTENLTYYPGCTMVQLDLVNIHKVRDSFDALQSVCATAIKAEYGLLEGGSVVQDDARFWSNLDATRWLHNLGMILRGGLRIASLLCSKDGSNVGAPVLVHCSDGWDRTPQVCCVAQIVLDPYFRTRRGLVVLVCKEWLSFGHQFATRTFATERERKDVSPVFMQWVDCVWQIGRRFPSAFDFNSSFLLALVDHLYAADTGTFCCDSERQSVEGFFPHRFPSLWQTLVLDKQAERKFGNSTYKPLDGPLWFKPSAWSIKLFDSLFLRSAV